MHTEGFKLVMLRGAGMIKKDFLNKIVDKLNNKNVLLKNEFEFS